MLYDTTAVSAALGNLYTSGNNLTNTYSIKGVFNNWGAVTETEVDVDEMIPTVAFHGELDSTVLIDTDNSFLHYTLNGSRAIHYNLIANNVCTELTVDTTGGHGIFRNASSEFRAGRASCFFKNIFCNTCTNFYSTDSIPSNCSSPVGINEYNFSSNIKVYPNPFGHSFKIDGIGDVVVLTIYNSFGQLVYKNEKFKGEAEVDLLPGIYFLKVQQLESNKTFKTKLIKN